jgi:hypothetical protein
MIVGRTNLDTRARNKFGPRSKSPQIIDMITGKQQSWLEVPIWPCHSYRIGVFNLLYLVYGLRGTEALSIIISPTVSSARPELEIVFLVRLLHCTCSLNSVSRKQIFKSQDYLPSARSNASNVPCLSGASAFSIRIVVIFTSFPGACLLLSDLSRLSWQVPARLVYFCNHF